MIGSDGRHTFTFTVNLRGSGANWSTDLKPIAVRAYDLRAAIALLAETPFKEFFEEEEDDTAPDNPL